jgi:RimJ/RimL family protein N-acetyltransferase
MQLVIPTREEAANLLGGTGTFRGLVILAGALPPAAFLNRALPSEEAMWCLPRLFWNENTREIVGSSAFKSAPRETRIEIGYGVSPVCRRRGYATEGVRLLLDETFATGLVEDVFAVSATNEASRGVLQKVGFVARGVVSTDEGPMQLWAKRKEPTDRNYGT